MKEKAQIKRFCDELASLWESKAPNMRFGQIVVTLNQALDKPRHDIFYLSEDEMMEVIHRFFSKEYKQEQRSDDRTERLTDRWQEAMEEPHCNTESDLFDLPKFKKLLLETWQYFIDTVDDFGIDNSVLPIIGEMYTLVNRTNYPDGVTQWEYEAYIKILQGLLSSLEDPQSPQGYKGNFYDGYIVVEEWERCEHSLHIHEFKVYFDKLSKMYYEDHYSDEYDENGRKWEDIFDDSL